jgi:hypothetical protein
LAVAEGERVRFVSCRFVFLCLYLRTNNQEPRTDGVEFKTAQKQLFVAKLLPFLLQLVNMRPASKNTFERGIRCLAKGLSQRQ